MGAVGRSWVLCEAWETLWLVSMSAGVSHCSPVTGVTVEYKSASTIACELWDIQFWPGDELAVAMGLDKEFTSCCSDDWGKS